MYLIIFFNHNIFFNFVKPIIFDTSTYNTVIENITSKQKHETIY